MKLICCVSVTALNLCVNDACVGVHVCVKRTHNSVLMVCVFVLLQENV